MALPLSTPIKPMLSKSREAIPRGEGWLYEPKWDGFRAIVFKDGADVKIFSRDRKPFNRYFPELEAPLRDRLPARCIVDGEIVISGPEGLEFESLLLRIHPARSRVETLAGQVPASFVAFDLIGLADEDLRETPFETRRGLLEEALKDGGKVLDAVRRTQIVVTPHTDDFDVASDWFTGFEKLGLDGIIAKQADLLYHPGDRAMVKVKHLRTAECVVGGYRLSKSADGVGSLLLGLYDGAGILHYVGHTSSFKAQERRDLLKKLARLQGGKSFGEGRSPGGPSRWSGGRDVSWVPLEPSLVCEVAYDHMQGDRFRHAARFLRWRPEKPPEECTFDQIAI